MIGWRATQPTIHKDGLGETTSQTAERYSREKLRPPASLLARKTASIFDCKVTPLLSLKTLNSLIFTTVSHRI